MGEKHYTNVFVHEVNNTVQVHKSNVCTYSHRYVHTYSTIPQRHTFGSIFDALALNTFGQDYSASLKNRVPIVRCETDSLVCRLTFQLV